MITKLGSGEEAREEVAGYDKDLVESCLLLLEKYELDDIKLALALVHHVQQLQNRRNPSLPWTIGPTAGATIKPPNRLRCPRCRTKWTMEEVAPDQDCPSCQHQVLWKYECGAYCTDGGPCTRFITSSGERCWCHKKKRQECGATCQDGHSCTRRVNPGKYCHEHREEG